jgi:hypothetical protein
MKTIDIEEMRGKLLTLDQARERLEATEHLAQYTFDTTGGNDVKFNFHPQWNVGLKEQDDLFVTQGTISIDGFERHLTKEAALKAASEIGLPAAYVLKTPPKMIEEQLNYWFANGCGTDKGKELKMLASDAAGLAFTSCDHRKIWYRRYLGGLQISPRFELDQHAADRSFARSSHRLRPRSQVAGRSVVGRTGTA